MKNYHLWNRIGSVDCEILKTAKITEGWFLETFYNVYCVLNNSQVQIFRKHRQIDTLGENQVVGNGMEIETQKIKSLEEGFVICEKLILNNQDDNYHLQLFCDARYERHLISMLKNSRR